LHFRIVTASDQTSDLQLNDELITDELITDNGSEYLSTVSQEMMSPGKLSW